MVVQSLLLVALDRKMHKKWRNKGGASRCCVHELELRPTPSFLPSYSRSINLLVGASRPEDAQEMVVLKTRLTEVKNPQVNLKSIYFLCCILWWQKWKRKSFHSDTIIDSSNIFWHCYVALDWNSFWTRWYITTSNFISRPTQTLSIACFTLHAGFNGQTSFHLIWNE